MGERVPPTGKGYLSQTVMVWDLPTRIFKWSLVLSVGLAFLFSSSHPRGSLFIIHVACGYVVAMLLLFRFAWGFVGGPHARFRSFMYGWRSVRAYADALLRLAPPRTTGHNPVGGWMIVAMLATLAVIVATGLLAEGITGGAGRLSALLRRDSIVLLGDLHAWLGFVIMWIAAAHVAGVLFESLLHRENLVRSMLTGRKETSDPNEQRGQVSLWRAAFLLILLVALGAWLAAGTRLPPAP